MYYFNMLLWLSEVDSLSCGCARPHVYSQSLPTLAHFFISHLPPHSITRVRDSRSRRLHNEFRADSQRLYTYTFFFLFFFFLNASLRRAHASFLHPLFLSVFFSNPFFRFLFLSLCSGHLSTSRILTIGGEHRLLHNAWESKAITESSLSISETEM